MVATIRAHQWSGEFTPYFQHGVYAEADDFRVFIGYGGRIHAWVAGQMMEDNPRGDRAGWRVRRGCTTPTRPKVPAWSRRS